MSTPTVIQTQARKGAGSRTARHERADGQVPVNVYGHGEGNEQRTVGAHELSLAFASTDQVFNLDIDGKTESCLVREVQYDTYGQRVLHVDFSRIDLSEQVSVEVALEFRGDPAGVAAGGTQMIHHPALAVRCRADSIPDSITVLIAELDIGQSIHAGEVELPSGIVLDESAIAAGEQVVSIAAPRVDEEPEPEEGAEGEAADGAAPAGDAKAEDGGEKKDGEKKDG
jgi:large subunit ribosomal protein L25